LSDSNPLDLQDPFAQLVNSMRDYAIFLLDRSGAVASWNPGAERMKGYSAAEVLGRHFSLFYTEEANRLRWPQHELQVADEHGRFEDEGWRVAKGGRRFWANVVITALRGAKGELRGFAKITRDLTERREGEELLRRSEERFRLLVEGLRDYAIFMLDAEGRVASWNAGAQRLTGFAQEEVIGRHVSVFYPKAAADARWPEQQLALSREQGRFEEEAQRLRKNGSAFWAQVLLAPLYGAQGELLGYASLARDLTERKRAEGLEKADKRSQEFLAMLAHELRNPLAPIANALDLLSARPAADATEQWAREVLQRQTGQLSRLVDDLMDLSRVSRSAISLATKPLDLGRVVRAAADASLQWMTARRHSFSLELPDDGLAVQGDETRLVQVVQNLLDNAAKYTPAGGRVELRAGRDGDRVWLSVKDNGIGMEADMQQAAFDLFRQGYRELDRPEGGLGIGLTLVRRLVAMHGGTVEALSAGPGTGTEVIVRLPALAGALPAPDQEKARQAPPRRALRVAVVDDNQDAADALRLLLESDGHEVRVAHDGVAGLALARDYRPDYVLLDIGLPRMNGYDIAARLRADPAMEHTTLVAVTGYGQQHDRGRTAAVGIHHHLTKPVEYSVLKALLQKEK
jgi:PAS domain S-box-containing protein